MNDEISSLRQRGIVWLTMAGWTVSGAFVLMALFTGTYGWQALIASVAINLPPSLLALQKRHDAIARLVVGLMIAAQPALLLYATRGIEWQIDMHMYFFVALASLTVLCDLRPIIAGALLIAAHHLLLALVAPSWVFAGGGGIPRVLIHALAVVLQAGILGTIAVSLTATLRRSASAREEAQQALESTRAERALREQLEHDLNERRRTELVEIGQAFETSVSRVATALADTALTLDETTGQLDTVARDTGSGAAGAAQAAAAASHAVATVADHIASLSASIGNIAVTVSQQDTLASEADGRSQSGGVSVAQLVGHSTDIAQATRAIAEVADHTNMLALNATIEAAAAGESGRGFAVVAQEVKSLSRQAAQATGEIETLLTGLQAGSQDAASSFSQISRSVQELAQAASVIRRDVDGQRSLAAEIEVTARQAATEADQIASRSDGLAKNARLAEQLSADLKSASAMLLDNVRELDKSAGDFLARLDRACDSKRAA